MMKHKVAITKKDVVVLLVCMVFVLSCLGAVGATGRSRAKEAVCLNHLINLGRLWQLFVNDNHRRFPPRGGGDVWGEPTMGAWPYVIWQYEPRLSRNVILCPAAAKPVISGGVYPFAAWYLDYDDVMVCGSYTVNFWLADQSEYDPKFWGTTNTRDAASVPLLADGNWKDAEPEPTDEPWETREQMVAWGWQPNQNEIKRVSIDRHGPAVNMVFLDFSVRKVGLKESWLLKWHRQWPEGRDHLPVWPEWMQNFKDY
ncbi:MAG: hypothetical protein ACYS9T_01935 [Planctomycetota bacterium]|jgi:prepilin-type processing-associated H-X9-DG protein